MTVRVIGWRTGRIGPSFYVAVFGGLLFLYSLLGGGLDSEQQLAGKKIFLDAGHGGIDSGARSGELLEKDITLSLAKAVATQLESRGSQVILSRSEDIDYYTKGRGGKRHDLNSRVQAMERMAPDIFISLHCNAFSQASQKGAQVFFSPRHPASQLLAECIQQQLKECPPGNVRRATRNLQILVLNATDRCGVLVEAGYLSNPEEAALLADTAYQQKLAERIVAGVIQYFSQQAAAE